MRQSAKSIYNHSRGRSCWCTGISTGKVQYLDRHGTLSRQYGRSSWLVQRCSSYWSGYGFVSGNAFLVVFDRYQTVFNNVVAFGSNGGLQFYGDICASGADHRSVLV